MVDGHVEEALDLIGMQVHRDEARHPSHAEHVSDELSTDRYTRLVLTILTGPAKVGDDGSDVVCRGALSSVDHQQQLHQIVGGGVGRLHEEDILATDAVLVVDRELSVGEVLYLHVAEVNAEPLGDLSREVKRCRASKDGYVLSINTHDVYRL